MVDFEPSKYKNYMYICVLYAIGYKKIINSMNFIVDFSFCSA